MLDHTLSRLIARPLQALAQALHRLGIGANTVTLLGFGLGIAAAVAIALQAYGMAIALLLASRLCDGLDGTLARLTQATDAGGFLDIALDFLFYASIPLAFALADPGRNALAAAALLATFIGTGSSFLAFAVIAAKRQMTSTAYPGKSFYFLGGLTEASETLAFFVAMCLWPQHFAVLAWVFAGLCLLTIATRLWWGYTRFR